MKRKTKSRKPLVNGAIRNRKELLAAHEQALQETRKLSAKEGFESLVRAGIYTRDGKLTPRYGG